MTKREEVLIEALQYELWEQMGESPMDLYSGYDDRCAVAAALLRGDLATQVRVEAMIARVTATIEPKWSETLVREMSR